MVITKDKDKTTVKLVVGDGEEKTVILPETEKVLKIKTEGNTYSYELDGATGTYVPEAVYTGYLASFEKIFEAEEKPEAPVLLPVTETIQFTAAGKNPSKLDITLTHTPKTFEEETEEGAVTKAVTDKDGRQVYNHKAEIDVNGGEKEITLEAGEKTEFKDSKDTSFKTGLAGNGTLKVSAYGYPDESLSDEQKPEARAGGVPLTVKFVKSVTHARADRSADTVQIKINSDDNINAGDIYNDRGSVLLLKRGEVLTQDRLDKLSKFERGGYITTSEETYQEILNSGKAPRAALQRVYEEAVGYTALKNDVDSIFSVTRNASEINMEATETVTKDIFTKIKVLDFPMVLSGSG